MLGTQPVDRCQNVVGVRREVRISELALAVAEPGEVEPEHAKPGVGQRGRDPRCRLDVLAAGEAVGKEGKGSRRPRGQVEAGGKFGVLTAGEGDSFDTCGHIANLTLTGPPFTLVQLVFTRTETARWNEHRYYLARWWLSHSSA